MAETARLDGASEWVELGFVERERTHREIIEMSMQSPIADISILVTKQFSDRLDGERSRTAIRNWLLRTDVQPFLNTEPNHITDEEIVIQLNDQCHWLYAAVNPDSSEFLHIRLFQA